MTTERQTRLRPIVVLTALLLFGASLGLARPASASATTAVPVADTSWALPSLATLAEADQYFTYLASAGFDQVWMSYFSLGGIDIRNPRGQTAAALVDGQWQLDQGYASYIREILDLAEQRGIGVGLAAIWGVTYLNDFFAPGGCLVNQGPLNASNSGLLGRQLDDAIGDHPALELWILGGDNFCDRSQDQEDPAVWANLADGLRHDGSSIPLAYHTPGTRKGQQKFIDEPWVEIVAAQTGHCVNDVFMRLELAELLSKTAKPVIAAELRYEAIAPSFAECPAHGEDNPVTPADVVADVEGALTMGVVQIVYGHNERWQWGLGTDGSAGNGWQSVKDSFGAPGEKLMFEFLNSTARPDPRIARPPDVFGEEASPTVALAPVAVGFQAFAHDINGDSHSFRWHFGDGTSKAGSHLFHTYTSFGAYEAFVEVTERESGVSVRGKTIFVYIGDADRPAPIPSPEPEPEPEVVRPDAEIVRIDTSAGRRLISGTALDDTGVRAVRVRIKDTKTGLYWHNKAAKWGKRRKWNKAKLSSRRATSTIWTFPFREKRAGGSGRYKVVVSAVDVDRNVEAKKWSKAGFR
ncbi:MAG: DUF4038 domain-containing protein [Acidimicrobiales bacterium]